MQHALKIMEILIRIPEGMIPHYKCGGRLDDDIKMSFKGTVCGRNSVSLGECIVAASCEHNSGLSSSIKGCEFLPL
jgi:hypothetical protein